MIGKKGFSRPRPRNEIGILKVKERRYFLRNVSKILCHYFSKFILEKLYNMASFALHYSFDTGSKWSIRIRRRERDDKHWSAFVEVSFFLLVELVRKYGII